MKAQGFGLVAVTYALLDLGKDLYRVHEAISGLEDPIRFSRS
ncbi:hypothetical protein LI90_4290 [Carbonactinospora thermoautotrophica]|uniref:Uncharacterized protein n=1 Tax=Carbonactinospora thermoautotrophica TaxID=1469144 RepID=A0A132MZD4_9ACTN|nr:hypothetical protein [Carbonactinospora thermoautotrophica]KWX03239.1 hypothetical protein LI90_4290 [Carbonactinospora thermoautotrophica]